MPGNGKGNDMPRKARTSRQHKHLTIELPPEFIALCQRDNVAPEVVLRGFIADLCELTSWVNNPRADGYSNNGSDERRYAMEYYERSATRGCSSRSVDGQCWRLRRQHRHGRCCGSVRCRILAAARVLARGGQADDARRSQTDHRSPGRRR
jgi:hypothetical protein